MKRLRLLICLLMILSFGYAPAQTATREPFFRSIITKHQNGIIQTIKLSNGQEFPMVGSKEIPFLFYINGKSYSEEEAKALDPAPFKTQKFNPVFAGNYQIEGRNMADYMMLLYTGEAPPLSDLAKKQMALQKKYGGRTITGVVKGPARSTLNNVLTGFILESGNEEFNIFVNPNEVSRLLKNVIPGDIVIIEVRRADFFRDSTLPVIIPNTLTKEGEKLMLKGTVQI